MKAFQHQAHNVDDQNVYRQRQDIQEMGTVRISRSITQFPYECLEKGSIRYPLSLHVNHYASDQLSRILDELLHILLGIRSTVSIARTPVTIE